MELTEEDRDEEHTFDRKRAPENRRMLEGPDLRQLETGSFDRGLSTNVDVRTPKERGGNYQWSARDQSIPFTEIQKRRDPVVAAESERWASGIDLATAARIFSPTFHYLHTFRLHRDTRRHYLDS